MDINVIKSLKFRDAFIKETQVQSVRYDEDYLNLLFDYSRRAHLTVYDDQQRGYSIFLKDTKGLSRNKTLSVDNGVRRDVFLLRIDGVLFKNASKCDCALLTEKELIFIEFKTNAANKGVFSREQEYRKSYSQLLITIKVFCDNFNNVRIPITQVRFIEAYAVFNPTVPQTLTIQQKLSKQFLDETKGIKLHFKSEKQLI